MKHLILKTVTYCFIGHYSHKDFVVGISKRDAKKRRTDRFHFIHICYLADCIYFISQPYLFAATHVGQAEVCVQVIDNLNGGGHT